MAMIRAIFVLLCLCLNTLVLGLPASLLGALALLFRLEKTVWPLINGFYQAWVRINTFALQNFLPTSWQIEGDLDQLNKAQDYLIIANHQSWADILVIQGVLTGKIPHIYFVLKSSLQWIPIAGVMCRVLGYPMIKRPSRARLKKHPHLRTQGRESIQKACHSFDHRAASLLLFLEGTRNNATSAKKSPYQHLLPPHQSGFAAALGAWPREKVVLLDIALCYDHPQPSMMAWLTGEVKTIKVHIKCRTVSKTLQQQCQNYDQHKKAITDWVGKLWSEKDLQLNKMK